MLYRLYAKDLKGWRPVTGVCTWAEAVEWRELWMSSNSYRLAIREESDDAKTTQNARQVIPVPEVPFNPLAAAGIEKRPRST